MPPYTCQICGKSYTRHDSLSRHMKARHSEKEDDDYEQGIEESDVKKTRRYDFLGHFNCHKCGQEFGTRESLERHIMQKERNKEIISSSLFYVTFFSPLFIVIIFFFRVSCFHVS